MASISDMMKRAEGVARLAQEEALCQQAWEFHRRQQAALQQAAPPWQYADPPMPHLGALSPSNGPVQQSKTVNKVLLLCN